MAAACSSPLVMLSRVSKATACTAAQQLSYLRLLSEVIVVTLPLTLQHESVPTQATQSLPHVRSSETPRTTLHTSSAAGVSCWAQFPDWCLYRTEQGSEDSKNHT